VDTDSYFASVEQQLNPALRGKPVGIVPMANVTTTCCIAASKEAKKFQVRTGTPVWQAKELCPQIALVPARHEEYIRAHEKIVKAVGACVPVLDVKSIDEMVCRLIGDERKPENATAIARCIKEEIRKRVGEFVTTSIGIGPNILLAKLGTDLGKPDGLKVIRTEDLPHALEEVKLQEFSGIGRRMEKRFRKYGVYSTAQMLKLTPAQMCRIWGSKVHGWRWWYLLRGHDVPDKTTTRRSVGHSHILPPDKRGDAEARGVLMRLVHKAAARMRKIGYCAGTVAVHVHFFGEGGWSGAVHIPPCQDSPMLLEAAAHIWNCKPPGRLLQVAVTFLDLAPKKVVTPSLFDRDRKADKLSDAMDSANRMFGPNSVYFGSVINHTKDAPMRISFTHIPDEETECGEMLKSYGF
jgi:DNA polymerase-4